jgi:AcrR family transcriptional regulator
VKRPTARHKLAQSIFHPDDLHGALVDAAITMVAQTQHWDFSLRKVARRAGVDHNTLYAHFSSKHELIAALAIHGFTRLREVMIESQNGRRNAIEGLDAACAVYLRFGYENPGLYRLMFRRTTTKETFKNCVTREAELSQEVIYNILKCGAVDGTFNIDSGDSLESAALAAWSLMHGLAMLVIDGVATEPITTTASLTIVSRNISVILINGLRIQD